MSANGENWIQPPTRYNAVGVIKGPGGNYGTGRYRERVTLRQLKSLAALPTTDTATLVQSNAVPSTTHDTPLLLLVSVLGLGFGLRRFGGQGRTTSLA